MLLAPSRGVNLTRSLAGRMFTNHELALTKSKVKDYDRVVKHLDKCRRVGRKHPIYQDATREVEVE